MWKGSWPEKSHTENSPQSARINNANHNFVNCQPGNAAFWMSMPWVPRPSRPPAAPGQFLCRLGCWPAEEEAVEEGPEWMPSSAEEESACSFKSAPTAVGGVPLAVPPPPPEWKRLSEKRRDTDSTNEFKEVAPGRCKAWISRDLPAPAKYSDFSVYSLPFATNQNAQTLSV